MSETNPWIICLGLWMACGLLCCEAIYWQRPADAVVALILWMMLIRVADVAHAKAKEGLPRDDTR